MFAVRDIIIFAVLAGAAAAAVLAGLPWTRHWAPPRALAAGWAGYRMPTSDVPNSGARSTRAAHVRLPDTPLLGGESRGCGHGCGDEDDDPCSVEAGQVGCRVAAEHGHDERDAQGRPEMTCRGQHRRPRREFCA